MGRGKGREDEREWGEERGRRTRESGDRKGEGGREGVGRGKGREDEREWGGRTRESGEREGEGGPLNVISKCYAIIITTDCYTVSYTAQSQPPLNHT